MSEGLDRPKYGSPELECKLVCDTLSITSEKANTRACYIVANSVNRPAFRQAFMNRMYYLKLIEYVTPPKKEILEYKNRHGICIRKMDPNKQEDLNKAACIALTCLSQKLKDKGKLRLIASELIPALLICYASSSDEREDVKQVALGCLRIYKVSVGHRDPVYPDASTIADTHYNRNGMKSGV
jgi:hypothetical protein